MDEIDNMQIPSVYAEDHPSYHPNKSQKVYSRGDTYLLDEEIDYALIDIQTLSLHAARTKIEHNLLPVKFLSHLASADVSAITGSDTIRGHCQMSLCAIKPAGSDSIIETWYVQLNESLSLVL